MTTSTAIDTASFDSVTCLETRVQLQAMALRALAAEASDKGMTSLAMALFVAARDIEEASPCGCK